MSGPRYAVAWTASVRRELASLPASVAATVIDFLYGAMAENPARAGGELRFGLGGLRSARRGDFRVIYRVDSDDRLATVIAIEHRADAFWPRSM